MHPSRPPRGGSSPTAVPALLRASHLFGLALGSALEKQSELRLRLEREPVDFLVRALPDGSETNRVRNNSAAPLDLILGVSGYFR